MITLVITVAPLRGFLVRRKWPSWLASVVSLLAIYALLAIILGSVAFAVARLVDKLPDYANAFREIFNYLVNVAARLGFGQDQLERLAGSVQLSNLAGPAQALLSGIGGGLSLLLLIVALVIFLAFDASSMSERLAVIRETRPHIADGLTNFAGRVRKYWIVTTVFGFIVAVLDVIALVIIGVPLYITWGVLAFVTNYIPNIGFILGVIPPALIALLDGGVGAAIAVVAVYTAINVIVQTIIQPRFTGDAVGISAYGRLRLVDLLGVRARNPRRAAGYPRHPVPQVSAARQLRPGELGECPRVILAIQGAAARRGQKRTRASAGAKLSCGWVGCGSDPFCAPPTRVLSDTRLMRSKQICGCSSALGCGPG